MSQGHGFAAGFSNKKAESYYRGIIVSQICFIYSSYIKISKTQGMLLVYLIVHLNKIKEYCTIAGNRWP